MILDVDDVINAEIYFEQQELDDESNSKYELLLILIQNMLMQNKPIKKIKQVIYNSDVNSELKDKVQTLANQQYENITGKKTNFDLGLEALGAYTFKELITQREYTTKKQAISFMARARDLIKEDKLVQPLINDDVSKYENQLEAFYRTQAKSAREYAYADNDVESEKNIKGWISIAVLDNRTSAICAMLHNQFYSIEDYGSRLDVPDSPPRHPNCRSILITVFKDKSIVYYKGKNLETFLRDNPNTGKELMGIEKYRLFEEKKIKLSNFVDYKGKRFYTNSEIRKRLNIK